MATLVLTTVGSAIGGPIGGLVGSFLGASIDRAVFGGSGSSGARLSDLAVQSSAYGEPIPRLYGHIRVAGNLIWSSGIKEAASSSGGKRRSGTSYSYSASFAVALAARAISTISRIWADGKLLRTAAGDWIYPAVMRVYPGGEDQPSDPLIVAAEGVGHAPAYRGLAYVVFEDLPLADYGNRIPNLTFEVIADGDDPDTGAIAADLATAAAIQPLRLQGAFSRVHGFAAAHAGSLRSQLEPLLALADLSLCDSADGLVVLAGPVGAAVSLPVNDLGATKIGDAAAPAQNAVRGAGDGLPDSLAIGFFDPARDYQLGLQRAVRRSPAVRAEQQDLAVVLAASDAKSLAEIMISRTVAARTTSEVRLPWRYADIAVGDTVRVGSDPGLWRVRSRMIEAMIVRLSAEKLPIAPRGVTGVAASADAGRALVADDQPNGDTLLHVLDLPTLAGAIPNTSRLWLAVAGVGAAWRRATIDVSLDDGDSYANVATASAATTMGTALTAIGTGPHDRWDRRNEIEVLLAHDAMWLSDCTEAAVLGGANLALLGDEFVQFTTATAIAPRRFRLAGLLRGRRGSESAICHHVADERFVMLDLETLLPFDPPADALGRRLRFRAGAFGGASAEAEVVVTGNALRPLSPVHLNSAIDTDGSAVVRWVRRSRAGFAWIDGVDAPLAEEREAYSISVRLGDTLVRTALTDTPLWTYSRSAQLADGVAEGPSVEIEVAQLSSLVGQGHPARLRVDLPLA
jgi:hypothetical protein